MLDSSLIGVLHSHQDGYISFSVKDGAERDWVPVRSIRADALNERLPCHEARLLKDSFFSINAGYRLGGWGDRGKPEGYPKHNVASLRYLCACYADLDFYRKGLTWGQAYGKVMALQDQGVIPAASIIVRSGRGMWLLWLLREADNPDQAPRAFQVEKYSKIQHQIRDRLMELGADSAATDAARYMRVPGSLNTSYDDSGEDDGIVRWTLQYGSRGPFTYTLDALARFLQVRGQSNKVSLPVTGGTVKKFEKRRKGWEALHLYLFRDFNNLWIQRRGFRHGTRNNAAKIYAWLLRVSGVKNSESELCRFCRDCRPPLTDAETRAAKSFSLRKMRYATISNWLDITPGEAQWLEKLPAAFRFGPTSPKPVIISEATKRAQTAGAERLSRIRAIGEIVAGMGSVPTCRDMATRLSELGFAVSYVSVSTDYKKLGFASRSKKQANKDSRMKGKVC